MNPWWWAFFHSVSAFNNAGFGLFDNNLMRFVTDPVISLTIAFLIIMGGIGYPVLISLHVWIRHVLIRKTDKTQRNLLHHMHMIAASSVQTRVAIVGTVFLVVIGTIFPFFEKTNQVLLASYSLPEQILIHFFQSVSTRTAGFNTIDIGSLGIATLLFYCVLMFIGANPAGTGGGIKIPTVAVLLGYIKDWFEKPGQPVRLMGKDVSRFAVSHAIRLFFFSIIIVSVATIGICMSEDRWLVTPDPTFHFLKVMFEVISAFGTVGLSMGYSGGVASFAAILSPVSKCILIGIMLIGRVGPLTVLAALPWKKDIHETHYTGDYPHAEKIQIG